MSDVLKKTILPALAAVMALGSAGAASAQGLYLDFDNGDGPRVGVYEDGMSRGGYSYRRHDRDRDRWEREDRNRQRSACTPDRALDKAERLGIRRARILDVDRRTIQVMGRDGGERVIITFARAPNCPVLR